ncbi:MAG: 4'-phosphopantetheinyl transferase superfamily protein [Bacteroidetes bacterium]|nr:4'-phosphopantetheinyl transferase superfamily protein [Bacteroidota bacterium]
MELNRNDVHIYRINIPDHTDSIASLNELLSADEFSKAQRYKFPVDKQNYIICRGNLRKILSEYTNEAPQKIRFEYSDKGKPFLKNSEIFFNLSHSGERCVIAVSRAENLGIDIERIREVKDLLNISAKYFSETEFDLIKKSPPKIRTELFFRIWTLKEAFIKATGEGLSYPLKGFSVLLNAGDSHSVNIRNRAEENDLWSLFSLECNEYYLSSLAIKSFSVRIIYK